MKLTVVFANIHATACAVEHLNEHIPFTYRTVQIELTDEQMKQLQPKEVGHSRGEKVFEIIHNSWLEDNE